MLAKHALSQLSYGPIQNQSGVHTREMVGPEGFEPSTSRLSSARSNQLSYGPMPHTDPRRDRSGLSRRGSKLVREERETKTADPAR